MEENLIRITPNKEKANSILQMVETTLELIKQINRNAFPSNITKEYYDVIRELISIILLLDGYKAIGEGAHKRQIEYLESNYKEFNQSEIIIIDDIRIKRNKIAYDGFFIKKEYIENKLADINKIINKLKETIKKKIV